jgi:hypothetical protein
MTSPWTGLFAGAVACAMLQIPAAEAARIDRYPDAKLTLFNPEGSIWTSTASIDDMDSVAGYYEDGGNVDHGFVRAHDGTIFTFDPQGSIGTYAQSINKKGSVTGEYYDSDDIAHGLVRTSDGTITTFDPQGSIATIALSVNNKGSITGEYDDGSQDHGFVRTSDGTITVVRSIRINEYCGIWHQCARLCNGIL